MPTYQYACTACGHQLEAVQSFSDAPLQVCPECQGKLRKVFSSVGIVFKGSGFYRTDSRSGSTSTDGASSTAKSESTTGGSAASSDSSSGSSTSSTGTAAPSTPAATSTSAAKTTTS